MPSQKMVNVTAQIVTRNILDALADAPAEPYHSVFSTPYYQQMLVARVLSGIRNHYVVYRQSNRAGHLETLLYCLEEQGAIEALIQESITRILEEDYSWAGAVQIPDNVLIIPVIP